MKLKLIPGRVYYIASCHCVIPKDKLIKRKRPDILNSRQPLINACPKHNAFVVNRFVICIDCGRKTVYLPGGGVSDRCKKCSLKRTRKKAKKKLLANKKKVVKKRGNNSIWY